MASDESTDNLNTPEIPQARVLLIGKQEYNIQSVSQFLMSKEIPAVGVYSLKDAVNSLRQFQPTHVFISVGFDNSKIEGFAKSFGGSGATFYVFPEETNKHSETQVRTCSITNKMHLNISGGGVHRIVESWLKVEWQKLPEELRKKYKQKKKIDPRRLQEYEHEDPIESGHVMVIGGREVAAGNVTIVGNEHDPEFAPREIEERHAFEGSNIGFVTLRSPHFEGYAVFYTNFVAPLKPRQMRELTEDLAVKLAERLQGKDLETPEDLELEITKLEISESTLRLTPHLESSQTLVKFIEGYDSLPIIDPSTDPDMICIDLERIDDVIPVDFDIYIRLAINQKYVKYVNAGDVLNPARREKLRQKNATKLHIKKEDQLKFENYCTYVFVNNSLKNAS